MENQDFAGGFSRSCKFRVADGQTRDFFCFKPSSAVDLLEQSGCRVLSRRDPEDKPLDIVRVKWLARGESGFFYASPSQKLAGGSEIGDLEAGCFLDRADGSQLCVVEVLRGGFLPELWTIATPTGKLEIACGLAVEVPRLAAD